MKKKEWFSYQYNEREIKKEERKLRGEHLERRAELNKSPFFNIPESSKNDFFNELGCCIVCNFKGEKCDIENCKIMKCFSCSWYSRKLYPHCRHTRTINNIVYQADDFLNKFGLNKDYHSSNFDKHLEKLKTER
jgi:hypothetical protein